MGDESAAWSEIELWSNVRNPRVVNHREWAALILRFQKK